MFAIDVRDTDILVTAPHRHGGVARMLAALQAAGLKVSRIEPRINDTGMYRLTLSDSPDIAVRILKAIGCRVTPSLSAASG